MPFPDFRLARPSKCPRILWVAVTVFAVAAVSLGAAAPRGKPKSFLWKLSGKGKTAFLLGSIHAVEKSLYPLPAVMDHAFEQAEVLVLEAKTDVTAEVQTLMLQVGLYQPPDGLEKHLSAKTLALVQERATARGLPAAAVQMVKPWALAMMLTVLELKELGYDPANGIDQHFYERAIATQKRVDELEGAAYQLRLLSSIPEAQQELFLHYSLAEIDTLRSQMEAIVAQWKAGNAARLSLLLTEDVRSHPEFQTLYKRLVTERNHQMADKIERLLERSDAVPLVVVGAAHLVGPEGLVQLFRNRGYSVTQL